MTPDTAATLSSNLTMHKSAAPNLRILEDESVRFVRVTWVDYVNFVRYRVVPIAHFRKLLSHRDRDREDNNNNTLTLDKKGAKIRGRGGVRFNTHGGIALAKVTLGLVYLALAEGFGASGEYLYIPDLSTARWLPYAPGTVSVLGYFEEKQVEEDGLSGADLNEREDNLFRVPLCPRTILERIVQDANKTDGISFLVGFETEVIFLSSVEPIKAVNDYGWSESPAILAGTPEANALEEIATALEEAGIELQMYHAEAAPGQYEIVTGPLPTLEACDALITTREIIMNVASKHGLRATLAPRVYSNSCGSAAHAHISLTSSSSSWVSSSEVQPAHVSAPPSVYLTPLEQSFLSGLLTHLPSTLAFTLPTRASYARMADGVWSGGTWVSWGRDNREAPIRLAGCGSKERGGGGGGGYNFELKSIDGTANPYLAISALLAAGLVGVRSRAELNSVGLHVPAASLSEEERSEYGVTKRMPLTIDQAREAIAKDEVLRKALGEEFVKTYLKVNKTLDEQLKAATPEEEMIKLVKTY